MFYTPEPHEIACQLRNAPIDVEELEELREELSDAEWREHVEGLYATYYSF